MRQTAILVTALGLYIAVPACLAYEPGTHQKMADKSATLSVLDQDTRNGTTSVLEDIGIEEYDSTDESFPVTLLPTDWVYLDPDHTIQFPPDRRKHPFTGGDAQALIQAGAALEDEDERGMCHFFDPIHQTSLFLPDFDWLGIFNVGPFTSDFSNPDWAFEATNNNKCVFASQHLSFTSDSTQNYSLSNVNDELYGALTAPLQSDRNNDFGNLFLSVGHGLHLLEDMAQPQHVRNDMHCDEFLCHFAGLYNPSAYEAYVYNNWQDYGSSEIPTLPTLRDFWETGDGTEGAPYRQGLSEFTNLNFVSAGTLDRFDPVNNDPDPTKLTYASPSWDGNFSSWTYTNAYAYKQVGEVPPQVQLVCSQGNPCYMGFYESQVTDYYSGSTFANPLAASATLFDLDLGAIARPGVFYLNNVNYQRAEDILVPQAIGYGTGFIDHIFRGKLDVQWDENNPGDPSTETNLLVTNLSDAPLGPSDGQDADLGIYYDGIDGQRHRINALPTPVNIPAYCPPVLNGQPNPNCSFLPPDSMQISIPLSFTKPPQSLPAPAKPNEYMFVYKGPLPGDNDIHIIGKAFKPDDPEFELITWNFTASNGTFDSTTRYDTQGNILSELVSPHWTGNCGAPTIYTSITCSLLMDVAFYRHDAKGLDREYTARGDWGIHAVETVEATATPPTANSVDVSSQFDFAKYTRDVNSQGTLLPFSHLEYQDCFESVDRAAVNRSNVFVAVNRYANGLSPTTNKQTQTPCTYDIAHAGASMYIDIFDHNGVLQGMDELSDEFYGDPQVAGSQSAGIRSLAASDQGLCLVGVKTATNTGFAELRMISGSGAAITIGPAQSLNYPNNNSNPLTNAVGCAATSDRYYVIEANPDETLGAPNNGIAVLYSYDHNGNPKGSVVLQQILNDSVNIDSRIRPFKIAASSNMIYVTTWQAPGLATRVYRYERTVNSNDMDTFALAHVPNPTAKHPNPLPNPFIATGTQKSGSQAIAVDMYQALSLAGAL